MRQRPSITKLITIVGAFAAPDSTSVVTWKPQLAEVQKMPNVTPVFDSSKIPGEIIDLMVVNSATLKASPDEYLQKDFAALMETMALMSGMKLESENKNVPTGLE